MKSANSKELESKIIDYGIELEKIDDNLIKLFNLFISSNSNYLYNKTYILDSLEKFEKHIESLKIKKEICENLSKGDLFYEDKKLFAIIDDYFIVNSILKDNFGSYYSLINEITIFSEEEIEEYKILEYIKNTFNKSVNYYNIFNLKKDSFYVRLFHYDSNDLDKYSMLFNFSLNKNNNINDFIRQITEEINKKEEEIF